MKTNQLYKNAALAALKGNWAQAVVATIVLLAITYAIVLPYVAVTPTTADTESGPMFFVLITMAVYILAMILVYYPLSVGYMYATNRLCAESDNRLTGNMMRDGFKPWGRNVWGMFLMGLFVFLWSLLLFIPGIMASYSYAMKDFILAEHPELTASEAIARSKEMMRGNRWRLFCLDFSFIGWIILCTFTLGIGNLWLNPYTQASHAAFYREVSGTEYCRNGYDYDDEVYEGEVI